MKNIMNVCVYVSVLHVPVNVHAEVGKRESERACELDGRNGGRNDRVIFLARAQALNFEIAPANKCRVDKRRKAVPSEGRETSRKEGSTCGKSKRREPYREYECDNGAKMASVYEKKRKRHEIASHPVCTRGNFPKLESYSGKINTATCCICRFTISRRIIISVKFCKSYIGAVNINQNGELKKSISSIYLLILYINNGVNYY